MSIPTTCSRGGVRRWPVPTDGGTRDIVIQRILRPRRPRGVEAVTRTTWSPATLKLEGEFRHRAEPRIRCKRPARCRTG